MRHKPPSKNKKPTCPGSGGGLATILYRKAFLQSWHFTHTRHSGPRRHFLTTTGSVHRSEAVHRKLEYLTPLDATNHLFVFELSLFSMVGTRIWLPPGVLVSQNSLRRLNRPTSTDAIHFRALLNFARAVVRAQHDSERKVGPHRSNLMQAYGD